MKLKIFESRKKRVDLERFVDTRGLICANSGGGKSYAVRKILEESNARVVCIVLDVEGEFKTLREKFDFLLIGEGGDVEINQKVAKLLPKKIMELSVATIVDISELQRRERILYVKHFLEALMELPRKFWKPCIIVVDEAHMLCGQQEKQDSYAAVIDLMTRGRKRGYCGLLCTQRISKLHKDAAAEANNVMIGRTGLDIDMKRASEILGFSSKKDMLSLRDLEPGEFYVFGPAISKHVDKEKIAKVITTHPKVGMDLSKNVIQPTAKVKKIISKLTDLPKEERKKIQQQRSYIAEIDTLKKKLRQMERGQKSTSADIILKEELRKVQRINDRDKKDFNRTISLLRSKLEKIGKIVGEPLRLDFTYRESSDKKPTVYVDEGRKTATSTKHRTEPNGKITGGAMRMLKAAAMFHPNPISKARMGAIAGMSYRSGTFGTYLASLKRENALETRGNDFVVTEIGLNLAGEVEPLPMDSESLVNLWVGIVKGGAARMLRVLANYYPESISKEQLGEEAEISSSSGTFGTYLATLKRNGLITRTGSLLKASDELFQ